MVVCGYMRTSRSVEDDDRLSLESQRGEITKCAVSLGIQINHFLEDRNVSATFPFAKRRKGSILLDKMEPGYVVIATRFDRMFGDPVDALETVQRFFDSGVELHVIDIGNHLSSNSTFLPMLRAFAQREVIPHSDIMKDVKQREKKQQRFLGGKTSPFGYREENGFLVEDETQQKGLRRIVEIRNEGKSYRMISKMLREELGLRLSHTSVSRILAQSNIGE